MKNQGQILYHRTPTVCYLRLNGEVRHILGVRFDQFIDYLFTPPTPEEVFIDLSRTTYIDSTNLGLLARIARELLHLHERKPLLYCPDPDLTMLLRSMAFDQVFELLDEPIKPPQDLQAIPIEDHVTTDKANVMLRAHQLLADLGPGNAQRFQDLIELLKKATKKNTSSKEESS
jgi:anti-anti-sigma regulatory factor